MKILILLLFLTVALKAATLENSRPNIIFVLTDDQGMGDLACLGNPLLKTPNLDAFYKKSSRFTDFHVSPSCAPTRAALMSGRHEFRVGVTHTIMARERLDPKVFTLPQALKSAGYTTGIFGKWHLGDEDAYLPHNRGFDESLIHGAGGVGQTVWGDFPPNRKKVYYNNTLLHNQTIVKTKGFCTDLFFQAGLSWIKKQHEAKKPYFAYISLNAPHSPMFAPNKYSKRFTEMGWKYGRLKPAGRFGMIENIDHNFGLMMESLEKWNALENTLIIFMTDNGMSHTEGEKNGKKTPFFTAGLRGKKGSPYEGGTRVPSFWYWKGKLQEGVDIPALAAHFDVYQTFCQLAGVTLPEKVQELDGRSLLPLLENPKAPWDDRELFIHVGRWVPTISEASRYDKCAVRTQRWRFVNNAELYDISADTGETTDVSAAHPEIVAKLRKSYNQWWDDTVPLMINEGVTTERFQNPTPLSVRYKKQLAEKGIPKWSPALQTK